MKRLRAPAGKAVGPEPAAGEPEGPRFEKYRNYLELLAQLQIGRRLRGKADASDLVQETFLEAHRSLGRFRGTTDAQLAGWLRQILAARIAKLVRRYFGTQRRDVRLERELVVELDKSSADLDRGLLAKQSSPSHAVSKREQGVRLADSLARLPAHYSQVLILRHLEGLSFAEVAERMERRIENVKSLWARALARLRDLHGDVR